MTNIREVGFGFSLGISSTDKGLWYTIYSFLESREHLLPSKVFQLMESERDYSSFKTYITSSDSTSAKGTLLQITNQWDLCVGPTFPSFIYPPDQASLKNQAKQTL